MHWADGLTKRVTSCVAVGVVEGRAGQGGSVFLRFVMGGAALWIIPPD